MQVNVLLAFIQVDNAHECSYCAERLCPFQCLFLHPRKVKKAKQKSKYIFSS